MKNLVAIVLLTLLAFQAQAQKPTGAGGGGNEQPLVRFFPNPASSYINFEFRTQVGRGASFQVFNFLGRRLLNTNLAASRITVNLTDYLRGVYIFQVVDAQGRILETNKFQVTK